MSNSITSTLFGLSLIFSGGSEFTKKKKKLNTSSLNLKFFVNNFNLFYIVMNKEIYTFQFIIFNKLNKTLLETNRANIS